MTQPQTNAINWLRTHWIELLVALVLLAVLTVSPAPVRADQTDLPSGEKVLDGNVVWGLSEMMGAQTKEGQERIDFLREVAFDRFELPAGIQALLEAQPPAEARNPASAAGS